MKYTNAVVPFENITASFNPRIVTNLSLDSLRENIEGVGLLEPVTLWEPQKGTMELIRGHRRTLAIGQMKAQNPKRFAELFGKGVPALVVTGITADEAICMKLDHVGVQDLSDPHELQRSANMLFAINRTEAEVAVHLSGLIDKIAPMKQAAKVELEVLKQKLQLAKGSNNEAAVMVAERDIKDFIATYRRGFVQNLHNTFRCPNVVMQALYRKATGQQPEGCNEYLPDIGTAEVTALWKAHKADLEIMENGAPKYNKERIGPNFSEKWSKLCEKSKAAEANEGEEKEAKPKAMSAKDMMQEIKDGKFKSELACKLTAHHSGDKAIDDLTNLDTASYYMDLVRKYDLAKYGELIKVAKEIEGRLIKQDQEAKAKETATTANAKA